jgi:hypothetical protein
MKYALSGERVIPHGLDEFESRLHEEMREASGGAEQPVILPATSPVPPGVFAIRAKPGEWIEFHPPSDASGDGVFMLESVGPQATRIRFTMSMNVGLGMWIVLKLFGKRFGSGGVADALMDEFAADFPKALLERDRQT